MNTVLGTPVQSILVKIDSASRPTVQTFPETDWKRAMELFKQAVVSRRATRASITFVQEGNSSYSYDFAPRDAEAPTLSWSISEGFLIEGVRGHPTDFDNGEDLNDWGRLFECLELGYTPNGRCEGALMRFMHDARLQQVVLQYYAGNTSKDMRLLSLRKTPLNTLIVSEQGYE